MALFFGGAVRTLLSEQQVHARLKSIIEKEWPDFEVEFERSELKLAHSVWPWLGLSIENVTAKPRGTCKGIESAHLSALELPISVRDLLRSEWRLGFVEAKNLEVKIKKCTAEHQPVKTDVETQTAQPEKKIEKQLEPNPLVALAPRLAGLKLVNAKLIRVDQPEALREIEFPSIDFELRRDASFSLRAEVVPGRAWREAMGEDPLKLELDAAEWPEANFHLKVPVREGQMVGEGRISLQDLQISGGLKFAYVPGTQVVETLTHWGVVTDKLQVKRIWFNGDLAVKGSLRDLKSIRVHVNRLNLTGDAGEVVSENLELSPFDKSMGFSAIHIHLEKFSLKQLLEMLGRQGYTGVIGEFGEVTGDLRVMAPDNIDFVGQVQNMSLLFSRRSVRAKQKITSISTRFALKDNRVSGLIDKVDLDEGTFRGFVSFNMDHRWLQGVFQIKVDDLSFRSEIKKIMVGKELAPIAIYGQGRIENGQVVYVSVELGFDLIEGLGWRAKQVKLRTEFADQRASLSLRAQEVALESGHEWIKPLRAVLGSAQSDSELALGHLSSQFDLSRSEGQWRNAMATFGGNRVVMASSGKWQGDLADGWLEVDQSRGRNQKYLVKGTIPNLELTPEVVPSKENVRKESVRGRQKKK